MRRRDLKNRVPVGPLLFLPAEYQFERGYPVRIKSSAFSHCHVGRQTGLAFVGARAWSGVRVSRRHAAANLQPIFPSRMTQTGPAANRACTAVWRTKATKNRL